MDEKQRETAIDVTVPAARIIDYKGLAGDRSSNIKGVPGIGDTYAKRLLAAFDDLDGVYAALDAGLVPEKGFSKRVVTLLEEGRESAFASKELAIIHTDVPEPVKKRPEEAPPGTKIKEPGQAPPKPEKPQPPVVSLRKVGENKKKNTVRVAVVLDGDPIDHNLFIGIQASGGSDSLVARRINDGSNESHPISVPTGKDIQLEILPYNQCNFPADLRKQIKAPKKLPIYKIGEKHLHIA